MDFILKCVIWDMVRQISCDFIHRSSWNSAVAWRRFELLSWQLGLLSLRPGQRPGATNLSNKHNEHVQSPLNRLQDISTQETYRKIICECIYIYTYAFCIPSLYIIVLDCNTHTHTHTHISKSHRGKWPIFVLMQIGHLSHLLHMDYCIDIRWLHRLIGDSNSFGVCRKCKGTSCRTSLKADWDK